MDSCALDYYECVTPVCITHSSFICIVQSEVLRDTGGYILSPAEIFLKKVMLFVMFGSLRFKLLLV